MLSQKLETIITAMEATAQTLVQREAAADLRSELREAAQRQACLRCDKAGIVVLWNAQAKDVAKHDWHVALVSCGAFHALPQDDSFGLHMPAATFFCTGETATAAGAGGAITSFDDFNAASFATRTPVERQGEQQLVAREVA